VCVATIIVLAPAFHFNGQSDDVTWNNVSMFIWATVEVNLAIAAGKVSLPPQPHLLFVGPVMAT
jgi:hypothetical protein